MAKKLEEIFKEFKESQKGKKPNLQKITDFIKITDAYIVDLQAKLTDDPIYTSLEKITEAYIPEIIKSLQNKTKLTNYLLDLDENPEEKEKTINDYLLLKTHAFNFLYSYSLLIGNFMISGSTDEDLKNIYEDLDGGKKVKYIDKITELYTEIANTFSEETIVIKFFERFKEEDNKRIIFLEDEMARYLNVIENKEESLEVLKVRSEKHSSKQLTESIQNFDKKTFIENIIEKNERQLIETCFSNYFGNFN